MNSAPKAKSLAPDEIVDELGAIWCRKYPGAKPSSTAIAEAKALPPFRLLSSKGQDQNGLDWLPATIRHDLRWIAASHDQLIALSQHCRGQAEALVAQGLSDHAESVSIIAESYLSFARDIEMSWLLVNFDPAAGSGIGGTA